MSASATVQAMPAHILLGELDAVPLGRVLERPDLDTMEAEVSNAIKAKAREAHAAFWAKWARWRLSSEGAKGGSFNNIVAMFGIENRLAELISPQRDEVVLDLAAGMAHMAPFLAQIAEGLSYTGIEANHLCTVRGERVLKELGLEGRMILHDLERGTLPKITIPSGNTGMRGVVNWGIYFPLSAVVKLTRGIFELGARDLWINQMTAGKFDPDVLKRKFVPYLFQRVVMNRDLSAGRALRAITTVPTMVRFGKELIQDFPIWPVETLDEALSKAGFRVEIVDDTMLWGQTTMMVITLT